jgi:hypothetical protein
VRRDESRESTHGRKGKSGRTWKEVGFVMQNAVGRESSAARSGWGAWAGIGALMGIFAGIVFALFQVIMAAVGLGPLPGELIVMVEGFAYGGVPTPASGVPTPTNAPAIAAPAIGIAVLIHFVLSAIYGAIFGAVAPKVRALRNDRKALIGAATAFGLLIWIVNFFVIAPVAFPWFAEANGVVLFFAHTLFYGTMLGLLLAVTMIPARRRAREGTRAGA